MATISTESNKSVTITGTIKVDDAQVKGFNATISTSDPSNISMSDWIINQELYKSNRPAVNAEVTKLEDEAYAEQERMKATATSEEQGV